jgi:release factor glutamine methyltransferase
MTNSSSDLHVTWRELLARTVSVTGDRVVSKWLCEHASGCDGQEFTDVLDELVSERSGEHLRLMTHRFMNGEPLQYVMGRWAFRRLDLLIDSRVLIPRPETELIVEYVMAHVQEKRGGIQIAELGTGSGAIGLALLDELPFESTVVWMTDASDDALNVARANAAGIGRQAVGVRFAMGNWYEALPTELRGTLDAIVSNPPYIAEGDPEVGESVLNWEPREALFAGDDGLSDLHTIIHGAAEWLAPGGLLAVEMGYTQADAVSNMFVNNGFTDVVVRQDLAKRNRFVTGVLPR